MSNGQILGGAIGAAAGFALAGPAGAYFGTTITGGMGALYGAQIGMMAGGYLDPPKGPTIEGPRLSDLSVQTSTYGARIPRLHGTAAVSGNVFWLENNKLKEVVKKEKSGGKGGGSTATTKTYSYFATFAVGLCEGPIQGIRRIWIGPDLFYDAGSTSLRGIIGSNQAAKGFTLYLGDDTQLPNSRMQADLGVANCPAYRGLAYIVFNDLALAKYGNSLAAASVKVEVVQDVDLVLPTYFSAFPTTLTTGQRINYADEHGYQTAEPLAGSITGTTLGVDKFVSEVVFRDYNLDGGLIRTERQKHEITLQGTYNLSFYKSLYASGAKSMGFAYRASGTPACSLSPETNLPIAGVYQSPNQHRGYAGGYVWFFDNGSTNVRLLADNGLVAGSSTTYTIDANCNSQSVVVVEDKETGRCFRRWENTANSNCYLEEFDPDTLAVVWSQYMGNNSGGWSGSYNVFAVDANRLTLCDGGRVRVYDVSSGTGAVQIDQSSTIQSSDNVYGFAPGFIVKSATATGGIWRTNYKPTINEVPLAAIVEAECLRTGLLSLGDLDTSDLVDSVTGYLIGSVGSVRSAIEPLRGAYPFDVIQSGYKLKFISRGGASVETVDHGELVGSPMFQLSREMDSQLANKIDLKFLDKERNYDVNLASWERIGQAVNRREIDMPAVVSAAQAQQIVEKLGNLYWLERNTFGPFSLPQTYGHLEPADVITVNTDAASYELRLTSVNYKSDGSIECVAAENNAAVYISTAVADSVPDNTEVLHPSVTIGAVLDIPTVDQYVQTAPGVAVATVGADTNWPGCAILQSIDGGQDWASVGASNAPVTMGYADLPLSVNNGSVITGELLTVRLLAGTLAAVTVDQMLAGSNIAAYGNNDRWEIIRFASATLQGSGDYLLTNIVRGDFGTEWATGLHQQGDFFVMLDDADIYQLNIAQNMIGSPISFGFVTTGDVFNDEQTDITWQGVSTKCLSAVGINSTIASPDIAFNWARRSRFTSSWWVNGQVAPVAEESERYEVDVLNGSGVVVRTINSNAPSVVYTDAQQTADFGAPVSSVDVVIYQISAVSGRGYGAAATVYA